MASATASVISERLQALQQLESAFGQPNGNMFFTYNGSLYQGIGVNADDTLRALNVNTGQITASIDPIDIYTTAMATSGNPLPTPAAPAAQPAQSSASAMFTNVTGQIGTYTGFINMGGQIPKVSGEIAKIPGFGIKDTTSGKMVFGGVVGKVLGAVGAFLSAVSVFQGIQGMFKNGITGKGILNIGMSTLGVGTGVNMALGMLGKAMFTNPAGWAIAGAVIAGSVLYGSINSMVLNGVTPGKVSAAAISTLGVAVFTNMAIAAISAGTSATFSSVLTAALFTGPWGWVAAGAMVLFSVLWSLFHQPSPEQVAAQNLSQALNPVIWTPGPLTLVGVGTVALLMGWGNTKTPPAMASLTVPAYYLNQVLSFNGLANVPLNSQTPSVIVEPGDGKVVIVSPNGTDSHGNALVTLQSYNVAKNFQFVSSPQAPPQGSYIPFFQVVNGKLSKTPNPQVVNALNVQDKMLQAVLSGTLSTQDAMNALNVAAAANKSGVNPAY